MQVKYKHLPIEPSTEGSNAGSGLEVCRSSPGVTTNPPPAVVIVDEEDEEEKEEEEKP